MSVSPLLGLSAVVARTWQPSRADQAGLLPAAGGAVRSIIRGDDNQGMVKINITTMLGCISSMQMM